MPAPNKINYVGEFSVETIKLIVASRSEPLELGGTAFQGLILYEDIYEPVIDGQLLIQDSINLTNYGPITGQEELILKIKTPTLNDPDKVIDFTDQPLMVKSISNKQKISEGVEGFMLNFCTRQVMKDRRTEVKKVLEGTYSEIVKTLLDLTGASNRHHFIEPTSGIKKLVTHNEHPFNLIKQCAEKSVSAKNGSPTYCFFENLRGFHFRTLDSMYAQKPVHKIEPKQAGKLMEGGQHNIGEELENILDFKLHSQTNTLVETDKGTFGSEIVVWNMFNKSFSKNQYNMIAEHENEKNINHYQNPSGGDYCPFSETVDKEGISFSEFPAKAMLTPVAVDAKGFDASFVNSMGTRNISFTDDREILQRRTSQFRRLSANVLEVKIYGNMIISVGDVVTVSLPQPMTVEKTMDEMTDKRNSGEYLVTHIRHDFSPGKQKKHDMQIRLTKDSVKEKIVVQETTYPQTNMKCDLHEDLYEF